MSTNNPATQSLDNAKAAGFTTQVNLDGVPAGSTFQVTWTFQNEGTTTWDGRYRLVYTLAPHEETVDFDRSPLGAESVNAIGDIGAPPAVPPGAKANLTMTFTAPAQAGTHATNWQLQNSEGQRFGPVRWLRAVVSAAPPPAGEGTPSYQLISFENSVKNFENMQPGRQFAGTWVLRNTGTAVWSGDYQVAYVDQAASGTAKGVRSQMGAPAIAKLRDVSGQEQVNPGESVTLRLDLVAPVQPGSFAFQWQLRDSNGSPFGGTRWLQIRVIGDIGKPPATPTEGAQFGMNVNIQPGGHPLDEDRLAGLGWVRFVFWASRLKKTPAQAYQDYYKNIIQRYANKGIRSLIILHQDTYWGNAPWDNGGWEAYAKQFGEQCGQVAAACSEFGDMVAYQVYNEQDSGPDNTSAIGFAARDYALVLDNASKAIRANHPGAKVIFGGLMDAPHVGVKYVQDTQNALGGRLPVDALAIHPYGRSVKSKKFGPFGRLADAFNLFKHAYPNMPLWITEVGVAADTHIGSEHYADIAGYIREVVDEVADNFADQVPVLIWFGWTDIMRNAGMNTRDDKPKPHVYDAFLEMRNRGQELSKSALLEALTDYNQATYQSYSSTLTNLNAVPAGTEFTSRWTYANSGSLSWGPGYKLVYVPKGDNPAEMTSQRSYELGDVAGKAQVAPGEKVTISLKMTAPELAGRTYRSHWQLRDPQGTTFGFLYEELTVVPAPTTGTGARAAGMTFVAHYTIPDNTRLVAGTDFDKQWHVKNTGGRHWGTGFRLVYIQGDLNMARGKGAFMVPQAKPDETVTLTIPMTAPPAHNGQEAAYSSLWRLQDDRGNEFGDPIWARIVATTGVSVTADNNTPLARLMNNPATWYSQLDPAWKSDQLGEGQATIGSWGCLMTCMAMALTAFGTPLTPPQLNQLAKAKGEFSGSAISFLAPWYAGQLKYKGNVASWPNSDVPNTMDPQGDSIQRIDDSLAQGHIVVAQVDTKPNNGFFNSNNEQHWVIIVKRTPDGRDYLMIDPLTLPQHVGTQPRSLMSKYGSPAPSASNETNLRNAIKSTLVYHKPGGGGS